MCGVAGILTRDASAAQGALQAMIAAQCHRGPDDRGHAIIQAGDVTIGLGHTRLSIIDLSPLGHQPMTHPETGATLVYNGEIYNFQSLRRELEDQGVQFRGHSDTEVLLHGLVKWGAAYIDRLEGMFALALYDPRDRSLVLARDPLGIKPLYVARTAQGFVFASEVRGVLASGCVSRTIDRAGLASLFAYGAVQSPHTIVRDVREFPAGCWQRVVVNAPGFGESSPQRYWDYPPPRETREDETSLLGRVRQTLDSVVRDHLISDVPVGVFLSSGLDSSIVAGLASHHIRDLRTFTVGFAEHADCSERDIARQTASMLKVQHTDIDVTGEQALDLAARWLGNIDQPSVDGLNVYVISKVVREAGITVALSGQGGDELFGGYPSFADVPRLLNYRRRMRWLPRGARGLVAAAMSSGKPQAVRHKARDLAESPESVLSLALQRRRLLSNRHLSLLGFEAGRDEMTADFIPAKAAAEVRINPDDVVWNVSHLESRFYMGNMLLRDGDANGMAHSLEIRVPFLDRRVIDLAYALPGDVRLPSGRADKHLLRRAFSDLLPPSSMSQAKRGFDLPIRRWMRGPLSDLAQDGLEALKSSGSVHAGGVDAIWQAFLEEPETPMWSRAWVLCVCGAYLKRTGLAG